MNAVPASQGQVDQTPRVRTREAQAGTVEPDRRNRDPQGGGGNAITGDGQADRNR
jgi:hypothetical protein